MPWSAGATLTAAQLNTYLPQAWSTWTPTVSASSGTFTTAAGSGRYIQYGKTVIWSAVVTITTVGTASAYVHFTLPVAAAASAGWIGGGRSNAGMLLQVSQNSATVGRISRYDDASVIADGVSLLLSGTYEAA